MPLSCQSFWYANDSWPQMLAVYSSKKPTWSLAVAHLIPRRIRDSLFTIPWKTHKPDYQITQPPLTVSWCCYCMFIQYRIQTCIYRNTQRGCLFLHLRDIPYPFFGRHPTWSGAPLAVVLPTEEWDNRWNWPVSGRNRQLHLSSESNQKIEFISYLLGWDLDVLSV